MAHIVTDRVLETTTTTGTGAVALGGAVSQFQDFDSQMANADTTAYFIKGISGSSLTEWEVGLGTWNTGNTLTRTTVVRSSNSNAAVNFSAGTKLIGMTFTPSVRQPGMTFTGALTPATNDLAALGSSSLGWADLFLASGGVVRFGGATGPGVFESSNQLWLTTSATGDNIVLDTGGSDAVEVNGTLRGLSDTQLILRPSSTGNPSLVIPAGTLNTTPIDGGIEADATNFYGTTDAGNRGYIPVRHFIRNNAARTYTSNTSAQTIFDSPANGRLTLEAGTYIFGGTFGWGSMSATSGNRNINILGAGTATVSNWEWMATGFDGATGTAGAGGVTHMITSTSPASIVTATTGVSLVVSIQGTVEVNTGGTIIPTTTMVTAAASVMNIGSFFWIERVGTDALVSIGQWD